MFLKPLLAENGRRKDILQLSVAAVLAVLGMYSGALLLVAVLVIPIVFLNVLSNAYIRWLGR